MRKCVQENNNEYINIYLIGIALSYFTLCVYNNDKYFFWNHLILMQWWDYIVVGLFMIIGRDKGREDLISNKPLFTVS